MALAVLGVPPRGLVFAWEEATVAGFAVTRLIAEPARRRLNDRIAALWPVGPYALAAAAAKIVEVLQPTLNVAERVALDNAMLL